MYFLDQRVGQFHQKDFKKNRHLYEQLHSGQHPEILFITCADSRINPHKLTQSRPGELFVIRNAGNIIPAYPDQGGENATIEYALTVFNIKHIIVCGHSQCGAMKGVLEPETTKDMPIINAWLKNAPQREDIINKYNPANDNCLLDKAIAENVLLQIEHLKLNPHIKIRLDKNDITLHGWIYAFETGNVNVYANDLKGFVPLISDIPVKDSSTTRKPPVTNNKFTTFLLNCLGVLQFGTGATLLVFGMLVCSNYIKTLGGDLMIRSIPKFSFFSSIGTSAVSTEALSQNNNIK